MSSGLNVLPSSLEISDLTDIDVLQQNLSLVNGKLG